MVIEKNWKCDKLLSTTEQSENKKQKKTSELIKGLLSKPSNGEHVIYFDNGNLFSKGKYIDSRKEGLFEYYLENGDKDFTIEYKKGIRNGHYFKYENNNIVDKKEYLNDNEVDFVEVMKRESKENYFLQLFYNNSDKKNKYIEVKVKDSQYEGDFKCWWENGQLKSECKYENGKIEGISKEYTINGDLEKETTWKNGCKDGIQKIYKDTKKKKTKI
jgi:antitoxin component YwqK of YwqJK toxin-antitoxin module